MEEATRRHPLRRCCRRLGPSGMRRLKTPERRDPLADVGSRLVCEFGGTLIVCLSYALVEPASRPVALACAVTALVYAGSHVSGGHFNPAVTVATWIAGRQEQNFVNTLFHVAVQIAGAVTASKLAKSLALEDPGSAGSSCAAPYPQVPVEACVQMSNCTSCPGVLLGNPTSATDCASAAGCAYTASVDPNTSFAAEVIGVAVLCFVMLHTTTTRATANNSFFGIAAGCSVLSALTAFGGLSGGAFNPAVAMLYVSYPASSTLPSEGIGRFWSAGLLGAAVASVLFRATALASEFRKADTRISYRYHGSCGKTISDKLGRYIMEAVGTMYLALVVSTMRAASDNSSTAAPSTQPFAALALGAAYTAMVSAGGHSSGGHYSPALSVAVMIRGMPLLCTHDMPHVMGIVRTIIYVGVQVLGGCCGGWIARYLGHSGCLMPPAAAFLSNGNLNAGPVWAAEALGSAVLVVVVCHVATLTATTGNSYFSIAAGLALAVCTMVFSGISGGVFNPAIALGLGATMPTPSGCADYMWIYVGASFLGAVGGVALFALTSGGTGLCEMYADGGENKEGRRFGLHVRYGFSSGVPMQLVQPANRYATVSTESAEMCYACVSVCVALVCICCVRVHAQLGDFLVEDRFIDGPMVATMPGAAHDRRTPEEEREEVSESEADEP